MFVNVARGIVVADAITKGVGYVFYRDHGGFERDVCLILALARFNVVVGVNDVGRTTRVVFLYGLVSSFVRSFASVALVAGHGGVLPGASFEGVRGVVLVDLYLIASVFWRRCGGCVVLVLTNVRTAARLVAALPWETMWLEFLGYRLCGVLLVGW